MDFKYYYLIQDVLGILISVLGLKLMIIYIMKIVKNGISLNKLLCFIGNLLLSLSGLNLILMDFGFKSWAISTAILMLAWLCGLIAYSRPVHRKNDSIA